MLEAITYGANFIGFAVALWLGLYLVTRNPHKRIAWLTGLMLWAIGGMFLNILFALSPPPNPVSQPSWLRLLFPFWPEQQAAAADENRWLLGWTIGPAIVIWHHVTTLLRGPVNPWRSFRISAGYLVAIIAVYLQFSTPWLYTAESGDPLYINALRAGVLYPVFGGFILLFTFWSFVNLYRSAKAADSFILRRQLNTLTLATFFASFAAPISLSGTFLGLPVPIVAITIPLLAGIVLAGYGIARYSALVEGRTIRRDFLHSALGAAVFAAFYLAVTLFFSGPYGLPKITLIAAVFLALTGYFLFGVLGSLLEKMVYEEGPRELRRSLRALNRLSESAEDLQEILSGALQAVSSEVRASYALLYEFARGSSALRAQFGWNQPAPAPAEDLLRADDLNQMEPKTFAEPLHEAALLVPLYVEDQQIGVILLGRPENSEHFSQADIDLIVDAADSITDALHRTKMNMARVTQITKIAEEQKRSAAVSGSKLPVRAVEQALRNITDYAYLGDSQLAGLSQVRLQAASVENPTHVDLGKAVYKVLCDTLEKLHPDGERPGSVVPREWYPYVILYDAYLMDVSNRDIMATLYISEGTFNRTRRAALRTVARMLEEMAVES